MSRKSRKDQEKDKNWEHSRYRDWRPSYREDEHARRTTRYREPRRRSFLGWLFRFCIAIAVIVLLFGPGLDYVNGRSKAAEGECAVRVVVDGDSVLTGCPDGRALPGEIAGYDAPELLRPGCFAEFQAALMAGLEIRKALFSADRVELRAPGATPAPGPVPDPATEEVAAAGTDEAAETDPPAEPAPEGDPPALPEGDPPALPEGDPTALPETDTPDAPAPEAPAISAAEAPVPAGSSLRVLVDGTDLAEVMLASGVAQAPGGAGWCE